MEETNLEQLHAELSRKAAGQEQYTRFLEAVAAANEKIKQLHTRDRFLRAPLVTERERQELLRLYGEIGRAAEPIIAREDEDESKKLAGKITKLAAAEHRTLTAYDPQKPRTLPSLLEDARTLTVDTRGLKLKDTLTGRASQRQPLTFTDDGGHEITGVFTQRNDFNLWEDMQQRLDTISGGMKNAQGRAMVSGLLNKLKSGCPALNIKPRSEGEKNAAIGEFMNRCITGNVVNTDKFIKALSAVYADELRGRPITDKVREKDINAMVEAFAENGGNIVQNSGQAGMCNGSRVDTRNAAYSSVADLLGVPRVVARAKPMKVITKDGVVEGTFMEEAKGEDPSNLSEEARFMSMESLKGASAGDKQNLSKAIKDISDLQVLDFLCGNVDRHDRNMFYIMNPVTHKLCGVQGIDNDSSFGIAVPKNGSNIKELTGTDNMMVVARSTYDKVMSLDKESLKFTLRGYGLTEPEIEAAGERLGVLKEAYKGAVEYDGSLPRKGTITVIDDDRMGELKLKQLAKQTYDGYPGNLFAQVCAGFSAYSDDYEEQIQSNRERRVLRSAPADAANRGKITSRSFEAQQAKETDKLVSDRQDRNRPSPSYDELMKATATYKSAQALLNERIRYARESLKKDALAAEYRKAQAEGRPLPELPEGVDPDYKADPDAAYDSVITSGDLLELKELGRKMNEAANAYLAAGDDKGKNKKFRTQAAKAAASVGERAMNLTEEELDTAERNERRALDAVNRRVGDSLEAAGWKDGEASPLSRDENVEHISVREDGGSIEENLIRM